MGRAKNSRHYNELSLWIVKVHLDTAAGLHLAPVCNLTHNTLSYSRTRVQYVQIFWLLWNKTEKDHVIQFEMQYVLKVPSNICFHIFQTCMLNYPIKIKIKIICLQPPAK